MRTKDSTKPCERSRGFKKRRAKELLSLHGNAEDALRAAIENREYDLVRLLGAVVKDKTEVTWIVLDVLLAENSDHPDQWDFVAEALLAKYGISSGFLELLIRDAAVGGYTEVLKILLSKWSTLVDPCDTAQYALNNLEYWISIEPPKTLRDYPRSRARQDCAILLLGLRHPNLKYRFDLIGRKPPKPVYVQHGSAIEQKTTLRAALFVTNPHLFPAERAV